MNRLMLFNVFHTGGVVTQVKLADEALGSTRGPVPGYPGKRDEFDGDARYPGAGTNHWPRAVRIRAKDELDAYALFLEWWQWHTTEGELSLTAGA